MTGLFLKIKSLFNINNESITMDIHRNVLQDQKKFQRDSKSILTNRSPEKEGIFSG